MSAIVLHIAGALSVLLIITGCGALVIPEGIPGVAVPPAVTPGAFAHLDLESLPAQAGPLPGHLTPGQVTSPPAEWAVLGVPDPLTSTMRIFEQRGVPKGSVILSLYGSDAALTQAAGALGWAVQRAGEIFAEEKQLSVDVGEQAILLPSESEDQSTELLFTRCLVLAYIHLETGKTDASSVLTYARRLDRLLRTAVC